MIREKIHAKAKSEPESSINLEKENQNSEP